MEPPSPHDGVPFLRPIDPLVPGVRDGLVSAECFYVPDRYDDSQFDLQRIARPTGWRRWVVGRRAEYLAGRHCARRAMPWHVCEMFDLSNGPGGPPDWPCGVQGSIAHSASRAVAVATRAADILGIGVDCEALIPPDRARRLRHLVVDAHESSLLDRSGLPPDLALTAAFASKEALFKAMFPRMRMRLEFHHLRVIAMDDRHLCLQLEYPVSPPNPGTRRFRVDYAASGAEVAALAVISRLGSGAS